MIIFINGSFGVGKTTTANLIAKELPDAILYDPEEVGFMLRNILGVTDPKNNFQDYPLWLELVPIVANKIIAEYNRDLIVPMTVWREDHLVQIISGLKNHGQEVHHFCLIASEGEIIRRVEMRGESVSGDWVYQQIPKCVNAFKSPFFETKIDVTVLNPIQTSEVILKKCLIGQK